MPCICSASFLVNKGAAYRKNKSRTEVKVPLDCDLDP